MISEQQVGSSVADFIKTCRGKGMRATHQRIEVLRELARTDRHPDAETVYLSVRKRMPTISLDTVYRTLKLLEDNGLASRVGAFGERARFDADTSRHHHFVCSRCGRVCDVSDEALNGVEALPDIPGVGTVNSVYIELRGVCRECRGRGQEG